MLQAKWTAENRHRLYTAANIHKASRVLEVGSGTGAIIHEIADLVVNTSYGIDIDSRAAFFARSVDPETRYIIGDGIHLPFVTGTFDATICHFLLLWVNDPAAVLKEMMRVTKSEGAVMALAEPDYGGRIDFPEALESMGCQQATALEIQGADIRIGRKLRMLFTSAGLENIHIGVLGGEWYGIPDEMTMSSEWKTLSRDLEGRISKELLDKYQAMDQTAWMNGIRVLYVPTFFAIGWVKAR